MHVCLLWLFQNQILLNQGFFFKFCDVAKLIIIHKIAIFGYRRDVKVKNVKNWLVFWLPAVEIWWLLFLFGNLANQGQIFKKNLVKCWNHIFEVRKMWKFARKKDTA
jgi:hypothetical protein